MEKKAWGCSAAEKSTREQFLLLAHELMELLEEKLLNVEQIDNAKELRRKRAKGKGSKKGGEFRGFALRRFTLRTLKFVRLLRNFIYRATSREVALAWPGLIYAIV